MVAHRPAVLLVRRLVRRRPPTAGRRTTQRTRDTAESLTADEGAPVRRPSGRPATAGRRTRRPTDEATRFSIFFLFFHLYIYSLIFTHFFTPLYPLLPIHLLSSLTLSNMNPGDDMSTVDGQNRIMERILFNLASRIRARRRAQQEAEQVPRPIRNRTYVRREHDVAHRNLFEDYFAEAPRWGPTVFRRRFRMRRDLFLRIVQTLEARDPYFQLRTDATGRPGLSPLTKCTIALRQLAYGTTSDMFDEYLHVGETTGRECLANFCQAVVEAFGTTYLRKPNAADCQYLLDMHERVHGFPGMLGSIDCMHWEWKNCPTAWKGQFTSGYKGTHPTMILEAIVDYQLRIWHAHFGVAGSNNDINVLNTSPLFTEQCKGNGPVIEFTANGRKHHMGYYLADGIYPRWPVFLKTISCPTDPKRALFAKRQEAARKDVERGFGVLQARWAIVKGPARSWYRHVIANVMYACIILHNMIIDDEGPRVVEWSDDEGGRATEPVTRGLPPGLHSVLREEHNMRNQQAHHALMSDMVEEVWARRRH